MRHFRAREPARARVADLQACGAGRVLRARDRRNSACDDGGARPDRRAHPLRDLGKGLFRADLPDPRLVTNGFFVLAATSQLPAERLRGAIPAQVKIGPTDKLRDLVMLNLPGIKLEVLQFPPRQIPFHANFSYFQLEASNALWQPIEVSRAMGLYVAGDPPGLEMQLWAIRT